MTTADRTKLLKYALVATGAIFVAGLYPLTQLWPSGWSWGHSHYLAMILGVYATLGVALIVASRDPLGNRGLIWFTVWSSLVHAGIMSYQAVNDPAEIGHLWGDVAALTLVAGLLAALTPRGQTVEVTAMAGRRAA